MAQPLAEYINTQDHRRPGQDIRKFLPMMEKPPESPNIENKKSKQIQQTERVTSTQKNR